MGNKYSYTEQQIKDLADLADFLQGSASSASSAIEMYDSLEGEDESELLAYIDEVHDTNICDTCGWWTGEPLDDDGNCPECAEEDDE